MAATRSSTSRSTAGADAEQTAVAAAAQTTVTGPEQGTTRTTSDVTIPSEVAPGDAPHDTLDPNERVSTVTPRPGDQAIREGRVNGVLLNEALPDAATVAANRVAGPAGVVEERDHRTEEYEVTGPDGTPARVWHNIDTGETRRVS